MFESNAIPHLYACTAKYSRRRMIAPTTDTSGKKQRTPPTTATATTVLARHGSMCDEARAAWKSFFRNKVGYDWEDRFEGMNRVESQGYPAPAVVKNEGVVWRGEAKEEAEAAEEVAETEAKGKGRGTAKGVQVQQAGKFLYILPREGKPRGMVMQTMTEEERNRPNGGWGWPTEEQLEILRVRDGA